MRALVSGVVIVAVDTMARLIIPQHPDRVFKDALWGPYPAAHGYHSVGTTGDATTVRWDLCAAFAVVLDEDVGRREKRLFDQILRLEKPFHAAEVFNLPDGTRCVIGFYLPETDHATS